jgi:putative sugar O-methyltransferase
MNSSLEKDKITDVPRLLDEMVEDVASMTDCKGKSLYWNSNMSETVRFIHRNGLQYCRSYSLKGKGFEKFGGGSFWPSAERLLARQNQLYNSFGYKISQKLRIRTMCDYYQSLIKKLLTTRLLSRHLSSVLVDLLLTMDKDKLLNKFEVCLAGEPDDLVEIKGKLYSYGILEKFLLYLYITRWINYKDINTYLEIGPGFCKLAEIVAKVNPDCRLFLVDIPPQLYVAQQYMKAAFPGQVAGYDDIKMNPAILHDTNYRIFCMAPWQLDFLHNITVDLAVAEHFHEMDIEASRGYMELFKSLLSKNIYISSQKTKHDFSITSRSDILAAFSDYQLLRDSEKIPEEELEAMGFRVVPDNLNVGFRGVSEPNLITYDEKVGPYHLLFKH